MSRIHRFEESVIKNVKYGPMNTVPNMKFSSICIQCGYQEFGINGNMGADHHRHYDWC